MISNDWKKVKNLVQLSGKKFKKVNKRPDGGIGRRASFRS